VQTLDKAGVKDVIDLAASEDNLFALGCLDHFRRGIAELNRNDSIGTAIETPFDAYG
jgi:hypothetical protein